jgi:hypothetical protein
MVVFTVINPVLRVVTHFLFKNDDVNGFVFVSWQHRDVVAIDLFGTDRLSRDE